MAVLLDFVMKTLDSMKNGEIREVPIEEIPFDVANSTTNTALFCIMNGFVRQTHHGFYKTARVWVQYRPIYDKWGNAYTLDFTKPLFMVFMKEVSRNARRAYLGYGPGYRPSVI